MEELLKEILSRDKSILARRDDLIKILDDEVPNNQRRTYAAFRKALTLNIGEIFLLNDLTSEEKQERARQILKESGLQDTRINDVINTFANALKFDVPQKKVPSQFEILEEKILKLENQIAAKEPDKPATQSTEIKIFQYKILKLENQFSEFKTLKEKFAKLEENLNTQLSINQNFLERLQILENKNAVLEKEIAELKLKNNFNKTLSKNSTAPKEIKPTRFEKFSAQIETPPLAASPTLLDKCKNFIADFNALNNFAPNERRAKRDEFFYKYKIQVFYCKNVNERMNNPSLNPEFVTAFLTARGESCEYWAYKVKSNTFAVVPNVKSYNKNYHVDRAMGEVFESNFDAGNYSNIQVERAAEFTNSGKNWTLIRKGKLILRW